MGKKDITIGVRVDAKLEGILKGLAEKQDRTVSWIARELITDSLERRGILKTKGKVKPT